MVLLKMTVPILREAIFMSDLFMSLPLDQLTGQIPDTIAKLLSLRVLSLSGNRLRGVFPEQLLGAWSLRLRLRS